MNPVTGIIERVRKSWVGTTGEADPNMLINGRGIGVRNPHERGAMTYDNYQLVGTGGLNKWGEYTFAGMEYPLFRITVTQRVEFAKICAPLFGLISSRMAKISTTPFKIVPIKKREDREYERMKELWQMRAERVGAAEDDPLIASIDRELRLNLPDLLPDASNFDKAALRWKKRIQRKHFDRGEEIQDWLAKPNNGVSWGDFAKKWTFDLHIHGAAAIYKKADAGRLVAFDVLPGGSVFKVRQRYMSPVHAFVQIVYGMPNQFFYEDEINYTDYMSISSQGYPIVPIESILNKMVAYILYDYEMASQADGTRPPEKILAVAKKTKDPFGEYDDASNTRMSADAQNRLEQKVNTPHRYPIIVLDQLNGDVMEVIDISKENIFALLDERQDKIKQDIALVFNAMPFEMGLTGSEFTSGRETSDNQQDESHGKGTQPLLDLLKNTIQEILPWRYGSGYTAEFDAGKDDKAERELDQLKLNNGEITQNELREHYGQPKFDGPQYDLPKGSGGAGGVEPGADPFNPVHTKAVGE